MFDEPRRASGGGGAIRLQAYFAETPLVADPPFTRAYIEVYNSRGLLIQQV